MMHKVGYMLPYEELPPQSVAWHRAFDRYAMDSLQIPGIVLMENAGRNAAMIILDECCQEGTAHVAILCGPGNNGGDGFVIARHLLNAGVNCTVVIAAAREKFKGDALTNLGILENLKAPILAAETELTNDVERLVVDSSVVVDALLGTGASGAPRVIIAEMIRLANSAQQPQKIAIDLPSGLDPDTGAASEPCFRADRTVTMVASKIGFSNASAWVGTVQAVDIGADPTAYLASSQ